jgi:hypothetical protein
VKIRFIGVNGAIVIPDLGGQIIEPGTVFEVSDAMGGRVPSPRLVPCMEEIAACIARIDHDGAALLRDELATLDYGAGLLAQPSNFVPALAVAKSKTDPTVKDDHAS